jgi:hypothetical protein
MQLMRWCGVALFALFAVSSYGGETEIRAAIKAEVTEAFAKRDFASIEARYAKALSTSERTPSGWMVASLIRRAVVPDAPSNPQDPGNDKHWDAVDRSIAIWARQFPESSLPAIAQSRSFQEHAWSWRGTGYGRTVTAEGWKKVHDYTQRSLDALMAREAQGRRDPYWYVEMINLARLQGWPADRFLALVQQATQAFPLSEPIYLSASFSTVPRWGGSLEAVAQFADYAVRQTRKSSGESMYALIYWYVADMLDTEFSSPEINWRRVRIGFDDLVKRYPDPWNMNHYAKFACQAHDYATAARVLARIGDNIDQETWGERANYIRCKQLAASSREGAK